MNAPIILPDFAGFNTINFGRSYGPDCTSTDPALDAWIKTAFPKVIAFSAEHYGPSRDVHTDAKGRQYEAVAYRYPRSDRVIWHLNAPISVATGWWPAEGDRS